MIQANELRIGNWLIGCNSRWFQVDHDSFISLLLKENSSFKEDDCPKPIPLTPEILEACGFVGADDSYGGWVSPFVDGEAIRLRHNAQDEYYYTANKYSKPLYVLALHQLQNLYFALTGEELDVAVSNTTKTIVA